MNYHIRKSKLRRLLVLVAIMVAASITAQLFNTTNTDTTFADQNDTSAFVRRYKIPSGYTTFTDANFYDCVANNYAYRIGTVPSTGLTDAQLKKLTSLECNQNSSGGSEIWTVRMVSSHSGTHEPNSFDIADTKGLEKMTNLKNLNLDYNNKISQINLSSNTKLEYIDLNDNSLTSLDISNNTLLKSVSASWNKLSSITMKSNNALQSLDLHANSFTTFNGAGAPALKTLDLGTSGNCSQRENGITSINISNNRSLEEIIINYVNLPLLDASNNPALNTIDACYNSPANPKNGVLVRINIGISFQNDSATFDLSSAKFYSTIDGSDNYSFNTSSKLLTVTNYLNTNGVVQYRKSSYNGQIQLPKFIQYDLNGGSGSYGESSCYSNPSNLNSSCSVNISSVKPTKGEGVTFLGWADSPDAKRATYQPGDSIELSEPKIIYAVWDDGSTQIVTFDDTSATITKTYGDANFTNAASTNGDGDITYSSSNPNVATVDSSTGEVTIISAGETVITANASETENYSEDSASYNLVVNKAERILTFADGNAITKTYGDNEFIYAATKNGDNNADITYEVTAGTGVATVDSSTGRVTINNAGTATITASISATNNYTEASLSYTLTVNKANSNIAFTNTAVSKVYGDDNFINAASTNSNGIITYTSSDTTIATVDSSTGEVTIIKSGGPITITATAAATNNFNEAVTSYSLTISQYPSTVSFTNTSITKTYGDADFINAATTTSTSPIVYTSSNTAVATVDSSTGKVTIMSASNTPITITASVAASADYIAASTSYTLIINKKTSTLSTEEMTEIATKKEGYVTDVLSTIEFTTNNLAWADGSTIIEEGEHTYTAIYTENGDTTNFTTESFDITVRGERRSYITIEGDEQIYYLDSGNYINFRFDADYNLFETGSTIYIDDVLVDEQYYISEPGSTIIKVSNDYLKNLSTGGHRLAVYFNNGGVAKAKFAIARIGDDNAADSNNGVELAVPNTGVGTNTEIIASILAAIFTTTGFITIYLLKIKNQRDREHIKFD